MRLSDLNRVLAPLRNRLSNMIARAVVQLVDDGEGLQIMQLGVLDGETRGDLERVQNYGFTSRPRSGAEAAVLFVGGHRDHGLVIAVDDRRYRLKGLADGEVALYTDEGDRIYLKRGELIEIGNGTLQPAALGQDVRDELDDLREKFASHTHPVPAAGLVSAPPGEPVGGAAVSSSTTASLAPAKTVKSTHVKVRD